MRRLSLAVVLVLSVFVSSAFAGPFKALTVEDAKVSGVDTGVVLTGHIVKVINDSKFVFTDGTGELLVNVNSKEINDRALVNKKIEISGVIEQNFMYTEIKADSIRYGNHVLAAN